MTYMFRYAARLVLSFLMLDILASIFWAVVKTCLDVREIFSRDIREALKLVMETPSPSSRSSWRGYWLKDFHRQNLRSVYE